ncbi:MAG: histidinol-phosphatase [Treponema sp.]|nr:histidinol-phosphatase [Treponema sp.]
MKNQQFSSMHTHSVFCDGKDDVETMCRVAYEKNLYAIGFSAHAPISRQIGRESQWHLKEERVNEYVSEVLAAKEKWHGKLKVFLGYEVDYIKGKRSPLDSDITALNLDYIIASVHYLYPKNGSEPFIVDGSASEFEKGIKEGFNGNALAFMHSYYDTVAEMITEGGFDILAHMDLIKKNCLGKNFWPQESEFQRQKEIANLIASREIIVEVNTGGINRNKINEVYPSLAFLKLIRELDIPVIITSDAHRADDINGNYDIALKTLVCANFKEHVLFNGKNEKMPAWKKINI